MIKYIAQVPAWGLQISALKNLYNDRNITLHFLREFGNTDALVKDGATTTSPLFYILQNGKVEKLRLFLTDRYPNHHAVTEEVMRQVKEVQGKQVEQPQDDAVLPPVETLPPPIQPQPDAETTTLLLQTILQQIQQQATNTEQATVEVPKSLARLREKRRQAYRQDKTFEEEYEWIVPLFNACYYLCAPVVAAFGVLFFYRQIASPWLLAAVAAVFLSLELILRRTIVRKCTAAFMRGRNIFGSITLVMALALSAWSIAAIWNGSAQLATYEEENGSVFTQQPAQAQITALQDSIATWRAKQQSLEGKWGVAMHISKDLSQRIQQAEQDVNKLQQTATAQSHQGIALWRYFLLLLEAITLLALALPVWYEVRCVQEQE